MQIPSELPTPLFPTLNFIDCPPALNERDPVEYTAETPVSVRLVGPGPTWEA